MATIGHLVRNPRRRRVRKKASRALVGCPQKRAVCVRARIMKPKKPNSAQRKVARVRLTSTNRQLTVSIPGHGHNVQQYSVVLVRAGRVRDLPGVHYKVIRGVYDASGVTERGQRRSKFGTRRKKV